MSEPVVLTAYNVKTKQKNVPILDPVISRTARGAYMVTGHSEQGDKLTTLCNEAKAFAAIRQGVATASGFEVPPVDDESVHANDAEEKEEE